MQDVGTLMHAENSMNIRHFFVGYGPAINSMSHGGASETDNKDKGHVVLRCSEICSQWFNMLICLHYQQLDDLGHVKTTLTY